MKGSLLARKDNHVLEALQGLACSECSVDLVEVETMGDEPSGIQAPLAH
jgi:hypothetical protein